MNEITTVDLHNDLSAVLADSVAILAGKKETRRLHEQPAFDD